MRRNQAMQSFRSRREFLAVLGGTALAANMFGQSATRFAGMQFGYAAITWGKEERQAADDIAAVGFQGVQFRNDALKEFQPSELRDLLAHRKLTFVAMSSGDLSVDPALKVDQIAEHTAHAKFVRDAGGKYLQILDQLKPYPRSVTADDCKRLGRILTELGKRTSNLGIPLGYHNHLNTLSEKPENLEIVMEHSDPKYVHLEFDTAHSLAGGGNPATEIRKYQERILFLHLKDVVRAPMNAENTRYPFKFVELGKGLIDFPGVFAALEAAKFRGWAVVELDRVPDAGKTPKECAATSKEYLQKSFGVLSM